MILNPLTLVPSFLCKFKLHSCHRKGRFFKKYFFLVSWQQHKQKYGLVKMKHPANKQNNNTVPILLPVPVFHWKE